MKKLLHLLMLLGLFSLITNCTPSGEEEGDTSNLDFDIKKIILVEKSSGDEIAEIEEDMDEVKISKDLAGESLLLIVEFKGEPGSVAFNDDDVVNYDEDEGDEQFYLGGFKAVVGGDFKATVEMFEKEDAKGKSTGLFEIEFTFVLDEDDDGKSSDEDKNSSSSEDDGELNLEIEEIRIIKGTKIIDRFDADDEKITVDAKDLGDEFTVRVILEKNSDVGSVAIDFDGDEIVKNKSPYDIDVDTKTGTFDIRVRAYEEDDKDGDAGDRWTVELEIEGEVPQSSDDDKSSDDKSSSSEDPQSSDDKSSSSEDPQSSDDESSSSEDPQSSDDKSSSSEDDSSSSEDESSSSETEEPEKPKHIFFNAEEGISKNLRLMDGGEEVIEGTTLTIDQTGPGKDGTAGGPMFLLTEDEDDFETTGDYSEYKTLLIKAQNSEDLVVTIYTGAPATGTAGSCGARDGPDCSYIQLTIPASNSMTETAITFENETPANAEFTMEKFRMLAIWAPGGTVTEYEHIEFKSDAVAWECPVKGGSLQKLEPPHCKTLITVGQFGDASAYFNDAELPPPAGAMTYWYADGNGVGGTFDASFVPNEDMVLQVGVSLKGNCGATAGAMKNNMGSYWNGTPVFLRVAYELDNEHNCSPDQIKAAFASWKSTFANDPNVAIVWHTSGYNHGQDTRDHLESFWPGNNNVDWIAVSYFGYNFEHKITMMNEVIEFAKGKDKPIMIGEASLTDVNSAGYSQSNVWDRYFLKGLHALASNFDNRIKMISFISSNWPANGWSTPFDANTLFTDPNSHVGAHKQDWIDLIDAKDSKNIYVNRDDITINSDGTYTVK